MALENPGLGLFFRLPYEIREQIWEEFAPTGRHRHPLMTERQKTDLSILRASRALYDEISRILYKDSCLIFSLSPVYRGSGSWAVATFKYQKHQQYLNRRPIGSQPVWSLASPADARSRGFYGLPFHKIETVVVNLHPPNPEDLVEIYLLWRNVTDLVSLFKEAVVIWNLVVCFRKALPGGGGWFHKRLGPNKSSIHQVCNRRSDHDVVFLPFCTLRNLDNIHVKTQSKGLEDALEWEIIDRGIEIVRNRSWKHSPSCGDCGIIDNDVDRAVAADYFWIHIMLWQIPEEPPSNLVRRDLLSTWFDQGYSGESEFERNILRIINDYPEIIELYDPVMKELEEMHIAMVCLYHHATSLHGKAENPEYWDQEIWKLAFPSGIPAEDSREFQRAVYDLEDWEICTDYMKKAPFLSTMNDAIEKWQSKHPPDEDEDDLSRLLCVTGGRCPGYNSELDELGYYGPYR